MFVIDFKAEKVLKMGVSQKNYRDRRVYW